MAQVWAALVALAAKALPFLALWLANLAGKKAGRDEVIAEQNKINAEVSEKYEEIEQEDRSDGPWLKD